MTISEWIDKTLFTRWGWEGWRDDDCAPPLTEKDKKLVESAVGFAIRALGYGGNEDAQYVIDAIAENRRKTTTPAKERP
jgi:hypothetical protein